jgi:hypothetical protein
MTDNATILAQLKSDNQTMSAKQLANAHGIPMEHIKAAKELNCDGQKDNRWRYAQFKPWYDSNLPAVLEYIQANKKEKTSDSNWADRKKRAEALIAEIKLKEMQGYSLDKRQVLPTLNNMATAQRIMFSNLKSTLLPKLLGKGLTDMGVRWDFEADKICNLFQSQLSDWTKQGAKEMTDGTNTDTK